MDTDIDLLPHIHRFMQEYESYFGELPYQCLYLVGVLGGFDGKDLLHPHSMEPLQQRPPIYHTPPVQEDESGSPLPLLTLPGPTYYRVRG